MKSYKYVYILGIGGIGMSAIARWFNNQGTQVFGYDIAHSSLIDKLIQEGIYIHFYSSVDSIPSTVINNPKNTLVVYTPSIPVINPILQYLVNKGYTVCKRSEVLSLITK